MTLVSTFSLRAQAVQEIKVGHIFYATIPDYMSRTVGINSAAALQFKNTVKDIAGFIIEDNKSELKLADLNYASLDEFYEAFIKDFLADQEKRKISKAESKTIGDRKFIWCDASYYDKDAKMDIYYFVGIVETKDAYYKVLCYGGMDSKVKYRSDFEAILFSVKD
ncbi:MAG: hypothetical protein U0T84_04140 [Chitinophagales bacterium]